MLQNPYEDPLRKESTLFFLSIIFTSNHNDEISYIISNVPLLHLLYDIFNNGGIKTSPPLVFSLRFIVTLAPELQSVLTALFSLLKEKWKASISRLSQLQNRIAL
jgi:hypothetical protein